MSSMAENDAEDVNDFLKRIQELGTKRDQEDEERNRKLEEDILQGRKERQARRAGVLILQRHELGSEPTNIHNSFLTNLNLRRTRQINLTFKGLSYKHTSAIQSEGS
jgi:hypothetical protein